MKGESYYFLVSPLEVDLAYAVTRTLGASTYFGISFKEEDTVDDQQDIYKEWHIKPLLALKYPITSVYRMPFNQNGANSGAKFGTYNDVAGNQTNDNRINNSKETKTGDISNVGNGGNAGNNKARGFGGSRAQGSVGNKANGGNVNIG